MDTHFVFPLNEDNAITIFSIKLGSTTFIDFIKSSHNVSYHRQKHDEGEYAFEWGKSLIGGRLRRFGFDVVKTEF